MSQEYIIYADESDSDGKYYSDFYGGALTRSADLQHCIATLEGCKQAQHFHGEVKWQKVTERYLERYIALVDTFFDLVRHDLIKVRIMFTQNAHVPVGLDRHHFQYKYTILYYQFIKHGFGLRHSAGEGPANLRLYLDTMPCSRQQVQEFKQFLLALNHWDGFVEGQVSVQPDQIAEVHSHSHVILQCLDIVLGAIQFRLNDKHKEKPPNQRRRGKRTIAKEKLYKHINSRIRSIYPNFNVGESTGTQGSYETRWLHPYRHWKFRARETQIDESRFKP